MFKVHSRPFTGEWFNATPHGRTRRVFSKAMKLLNRLLIIVTIVGLATMLVSVSAHASDLAFDAAGNPKQAGAYNNRGNAKGAAGDLDGAIADYTHALQLDPKLAEAYYNRGNAKRDKDELDGAIADYNRAIELNPKYAAAYNNRGNAKEHKSDVEGNSPD